VAGALSRLWLPGNDGNPADYMSTGGAYTGVACVSASTCVAVDDGGDVVSSKDATGGRRKWRGFLVDPHADVDLVCVEVPVRGGR